MPLPLDNSQNGLICLWEWPEKENWEAAKVLFNKIKSCEVDLGKAYDKTVKAMDEKTRGRTSKETLQRFADQLEDIRAEACLGCLGHKKLCLDLWGGRV